MIDKSQLTKEEQEQLQLIALEKRAKQLEEELEEIQAKAYGLKDGKKSLDELKQYFKGILYDD